MHKFLYVFLYRKNHNNKRTSNFRRSTEVKKLGQYIVPKYIEKIYKILKNKQNIIFIKV